jgi:hypothetical protein
MPLVGIRVGRVLAAGGMPQNMWSPSGELLMDPRADLDRAADLLVRGLDQLPWPMLWLDNVVYDAPRWLTLLSALGQAHVATTCRLRYRVGLIPIGHDWAAYEQSWSAGHRRNMRRYRRKLEEQGPVEFQLLRQFSSGQIEPLLRRGLELEDRSWKGQAGSSVLKQPGMFEFLLEQAEQLAAWGQLAMAFLEHRGEPIAFEYGWNAQGVHHSSKLGYDPAFASYSPGQLLIGSLLRELHNDPGQHTLNCLGPLTDYLAAWQGQTFPIGRLVIASRSMLGRAAVLAYRHLWPAGDSATAPVELGDATSC